MKKVNLFSQVSFWGAILSLYIGVSPSLHEILDKGISKRVILGIFDNIAASLLIIIGRYYESGIPYTPTGVPGRNAEDIDD